MTHPQSGPAFSGSIPELYDRYLVPVLFESYARDLAGRVRDRRPAAVLEVAAGSGVVTRALADSTGADTAITATDLSQAMIDEAQAVGTSRPVEWGQADIMALPFDDDAFDIVVSQFGVMFLPDKGRGFAEVRRVLRPGGVFVFSVWDRIENNGFSKAVQDGLEAHFPHDPPRFLPDAAFGYYEEQGIRSDLADGGFDTNVVLEVIDETSRARDSEMAAVAMCHGGPVRTEIEDRDPEGLVAATAAAASVLRDRYGATDLVAPMRAFLFSAPASS
jgi:SAM-dependent methyltransferase